MTLGANIGTTVTGLISARVSDNIDALQVALAHLFFNITGIIIWYPLVRVFYKKKKKKKDAPLLVFDLFHDEVVTQYPTASLFYLAFGTISSLFFETSPSTVHVNLEKQLVFGVGSPFSTSLSCFWQFLEDYSEFRACSPRRRQV